jgi:hypothetical protein
LGDQIGKRQREGCGPCDQYIIESRQRQVAGRENCLAQPPPDAVALDRVAGLACDRDAEAGSLSGFGLQALSRDQREGRAGNAPCLAQRKEILALAQPLRRAPNRCLLRRVQADRRLRPRARRAASTLRPPLVDMRERKPWRRLRTSLLG